MAAAPGAIEIGDRREAIRAAVGSLKRGDTLIIAGKGHENYQEVDGVRFAISDYSLAAQALAACSASSVYLPPTGSRAPATKQAPYGQ